MFELTYRCNFKCDHCYVPLLYRKRPELATRHVFHILDQLKAAGCFYLGFTGGEPLLRSDALPILSYACRSGFEVALYTNGSLIDASLARELARLRLNKIDITVPGFSAQVFDRVTGLPGSRQKVFRAIELLHARKVPLALKSCVLPENPHEIPRIGALARSIGAFYRVNDQLSARLDGSGLLQREGDGAGAKGRRDLCACGIAATQAAVTPQGRLKPCLMLEDPTCDILKLGLDHAWSRLRRGVGRLAHQAAATPLGTSVPCLAEWRLAGLAGPAPL
jgi:molybdenum cofactor biosynthesis enzyme MoaA